MARGAGVKDNAKKAQSRDLALARNLAGSVMTFDQWLAKNGSQIKVQ